MPMIDFAPAARTMADLIGRVHDGQLDNPTPCPDYTLGDLLDHVGGLTVAFTTAATKSTSPGGPGPSGDASRLGDDWRERIPADLDALVAAWRDPAAWTGFTQAGGIDMPGEVAGLVALDELVLHGWDVARAIGAPYECDAATVEACIGLVAQFSNPGDEAQRGGAFGPVVHVPRDAAPIDRLVGLSGRDPSWSAR